MVVTIVAFLLMKKLKDRARLLFLMETFIKGI